MRRLLVDCGNTGTKLALAEAASLGHPTADTGSLLPEADELILLGGNRATAADIRNRWPGAVRELGQELPVPAVGQYDTMGLDRICAGIAAVRQVAGNCLVVDGGTATTLGAWGIEGGHIRFAGGLILPGEQACLDGLHHAAPALPQVQHGPSAGALQKETESAIRSACALGYGSMVRACLSSISVEFPTDIVVVTGGRMEWLHELLSPCHKAPDLVLTGLLHIALEESSP
jgi:pantothenate kinase type III